MLIIITIIITAAAVLASIFGWRDHQDLRATRAALSAVQSQRDEAIVAGQLAYARGHEDGMHDARTQDARERLIRVRKQQTAAADRQVRLN